MAELRTTEIRGSSCCDQETQESCGVPAAREQCCQERADSGCGCDAGQPIKAGDIRETVRARYAAAARQAADAGSWCCEAGFDPADTGEQTFGATLYGEEGAGALEDAVKASLGCGVPTASPTFMRARPCSTSARALERAACVVCDAGMGITQKALAPRTARGPRSRSGATAGSGPPRRGGRCGRASSRKLKPSRLRGRSAWRASSDREPSASWRRSQRRRPGGRRRNRDARPGGAQVTRYRPGAQRRVRSSTPTGSVRYPDARPSALPYGQAEAGWSTVGPKGAPRCRRSKKRHRSFWPTSGLRSPASPGTRRITAATSCTSAFATAATRCSQSTPTPMRSKAIAAITTCARSPAASTRS